MFEKYIERKQEQVSSVLDLSESRNNISEVLDNDNIDKSIKHYIYSEVDWWIYKIRLARGEVKYFDMEDSELKQEYNKLDSMLKKKAILSNAEFTNLLNSAIKARFNVLLRPRIALVWFVYRDKDKLSINEIKHRLKYFTDYSYIYDGFIKKANENKFDDNDVIGLEDFKSIIEEVDNEFVFNLNSDGLISLLEPLYKIFDYKNAEGNYLLPVEALIVFFDDKSIYQLVDKFDEQINEAGIEFLDQGSLLEIIQSLSEDSDDEVEEEIIDGEDEGELEDIEELGELEIIDDEFENNDSNEEEFEEGGFDEVEFDVDEDKVDEKSLEAENDLAELSDDEENEIESNTDDFNFELGEAFDEKNKNEDVAEEEIIDDEDEESVEELEEFEKIDDEISEFSDENIDNIVDDELVETENELEIDDDLESEMIDINHFEKEIDDELSEELESEFGELEDELNSELGENFDKDLENELEQELSSELEDDKEVNIEDYSSSSNEDSDEDFDEDFDALADRILNSGKESEGEDTKGTDDVPIIEDVQKKEEELSDDSGINTSIDEISEMLSKSIDTGDYKEVKDFINEEKSEQSLEEPNEMQQEIIEVLKELKK